MTGAKADDSDALKAVLAAASHAEWCTGDWAECSTRVGHSLEDWGTASRLLPLVLAYGREQATRALRDAAREEYRVSEDCENHCDDATKARLLARADDLGRQT